MTRRHTEALLFVGSGGSGGNLYGAELFHSTDFGCPSFGNQLFSVFWRIAASDSVGHCDKETRLHPIFSFVRANVRAELVLRPQLLFFVCCWFFERFFRRRVHSF